jgi:hypothetical protein
MDTVLAGKLENRDYSEDLDLKGRIILERILGKCGRKK